MSCSKGLRFLLAAMLVITAGARAEEKVWSAVILASNPKPDQPAKPAPVELSAFEKRLSKFFGYRQLEILGASTKAMDGQTEQWLVPTPNFWAGTKATREAGGYVLEIQFFHDNRLILETKAKLSPRSPIFIRGPVHSRGQVIMVFEVRP